MSASEDPALHHAFGQLSSTTERSCVPGQNASTVRRALVHTSQYRPDQAWKVGWFAGGQAVAQLVQASTHPTPAPLEWQGLSVSSQWCRGQVCKTCRVCKGTARRPNPNDMLGQGQVSERGICVMPSQWHRNTFEQVCARLLVANREACWSEASTHLLRWRECSQAQKGRHPCVLTSQKRLSQSLVATHAWKGQS